MIVLSRRTAMLAGLMALGVSSGAAAQQAADVVIGITYQESAGRILVNGVPIRSFASDPRARAAADNTVTETLAPWLNKGANTVTVESRARAPGGFSEVRIFRRSDETPEMVGKRIVGSGSVERTLTIDDAPRWAWMDSQVWTGDPRAVLAAVAYLHDSFARRNTAAFDASRRAMERDMGRAFGAMPAKAREGMYRFIGQARLAPLNLEDLKVTAHYGNRLFVVSRADGTAPIQAYTGNERKPDIKMDTGQFWVRENDTWQVVR